jgi:hypothetical protein
LEGMSPEKMLIWFLRASAVLFMCAAPFVVCPTEWMSAAYRELELGTFPDVPLVQYLTRSVSALYTMLGVNYWYLSRDIRRYLPLMRFTVPVTMVFNVTVIALDLWIPMPLSWTIGEAMSLFGWTAVLWWLLRRVQG